MTGNLLLLILVIWPFIGSLLVYLAGKKRAADGLVVNASDNKILIDRTALAVSLVEAAVAVMAIVTAVNNPAMASLKVPYIEGFGLNFAFDGFRMVYTCITILMWVCSTAISAEYFGKENTIIRYYCLSMWTFAATLGVFISADLITTFTFFEIMSLASYAYVAHTEKKEAMKAAETYLAVAVIGGLVMLMGLLLLYSMTGTLNIFELKEHCEEILTEGDKSIIKKLYAAGGCILFGFGAKAGMFPLHIWLPKAHPVAPAPASALLSGVLTKSGVFGILILCLEIFADNFAFGFVVIMLGVLTMFVGALLAVFSVDLKRTLACSSVSQIGFILIGVGLVPLLEGESTLALSGAMLYMVNHSLFKLTLFLCAAAIYMKCHMLNLNDIKGYGRDLPVLKALFIIGALGISGVPLLSGYISKTLIHEGLVEYIHEAGDLHTLFKTIEILFLVSGGMTFSYMMKLFHAIFVDRPNADCKYAGKDKKISVLSYISIATPAALIVLFGVAPGLFIKKLAVVMGKFNTAFYNEEQLEVLDHLKIFSLENLKGAMISLGLGTVFFILIRLFLTEGDKRKSPVYLNRWPEKLDLENLVYRPILCGLFPWIFRHIYVTEILRFIWKTVLLVGAWIARFVCNSVDKCIDFMRLHIFGELTETQHPILNKLKVRYEKAEEDYKVVSSGISFGLMLIGIGLCTTLIYLLYLLFS